MYLGKERLGKVGKVRLAKVRLGPYGTKIELHSPNDVLLQKDKA